MNSKKFEFDIALSFAGEDRRQAAALAKKLVKRGVRVFYDDFAQSSLWGKDLYQHLAEIYNEKSRYCVIFVSENYISKNWTKHELTHAQPRAFASDREYILPIRLDDSILPGAPATVGYIDLQKTTLQKITSLLLEKLGISLDNQNDDESESLKWDGEVVEYNGTKVASFWPRHLERAQLQQSYIVERPYPRIRFGNEKRFSRSRKPRLIGPCHDCAAMLGQYHVYGCDMEECPGCGGQNIACGCLHRPVTEDEIEKWANFELD